MSVPEAPEVGAAPRCVVTGAGGFIGRRLCRRLQATQNVRAIVRQEIDGPWDDAATIDLGTGEVSPAALEGAGVVFHLASKTHDIRESASTEDYERVNVRGTAALLRACREAGVKRVVFASSVKAMSDARRAIHAS